ncbi:MAG: phosphate-starvation-inducible PsiE family protein [Gammaproteobacteria bacterium]|nr:phosphate-starvation-inducible PsiE family protein [Gammaproteobacteria bacterium]
MHLLEHTVLVVIALATTAAILQEIVAMVNLLEVHLADLLLLFIYLEVLAMVRAYWESGKLPVRMPLYIAIVALARYLILDMKAIDSIRILAAAGGALILALAVLAIRYGHVKYPYGRERSAGGDEIEIE